MGHGPTRPTRPAAPCWAAPVWAALGLACLGAAEAQTDPGAPPAAALAATRERAEETVAIPVASLAEGETALRAVEGRTLWRAWRIADPEASVADALAFYREAAEGAEIVFACRDDACGGIDFRFHAHLLPAPAMLIDTADLGHLTLDLGGGSWLSVTASRVLGALHIQTVSVAPPDPGEPSDGASGGPSEAKADPGPLAPMADATIPPRDIASLRRRLLAEGHVRVDGLAFETGGAALSGESAETLDMLAAFLRADGGIEVVIVGHSDWEGGLEVNRALSKARAEAVMAALVERGVPEAQLAAEGIGFLAPVASNRDAAGRALNRRVELVLRAPLGEPPDPEEAGEVPTPPEE